MSTDEAVPAQAFWQAGSTSQALPLQGMASPLPVRCSPGSARRTSFASPSPHWKITSLHDQLRRAHRTDAECDDRDRGHREHWQRGIGNGTAWSKEADIEWCHIQLQQRANNDATRRQRCKQNEAAVTNLGSQIGTACGRGAECDDVERVHRLRWGEPNGLGWGTPWSMEANGQRCHMEHTNIHRTASTAPQHMASPSQGRLQPRGAVHEPATESPPQQRRRHSMPSPSELQSRAAVPRDEATAKEKHRRGMFIQWTFGTRKENPGRPAWSADVEVQHRQQQGRPPGRQGQPSNKLSQTLFDKLRT